MRIIWVVQLLNFVIRKTCLYHIIAYLFLTYYEWKWNQNHMFISNHSIPISLGIETTPPSKLSSWRAMKMKKKTNPLSKLSPNCQVDELWNWEKTNPLSNLSRWYDYPTKMETKPPHNPTCHADMIRDMVVINICWHV